MKFSPTVAEMADISPMCSIMEARAMGAITRMEERSNLATEPVKSVKKGWRPAKLALLTLEKSIRGAPAAVVTPARLAATATK